MICIICFNEECNCFSKEEKEEKQMRKKLAKQSDEISEPRDYKMPKHDDELVD